MKRPILIFISLLALIGFFSIGMSPAEIVEHPRLGTWVTVFTPEKALYSRENADKLISYCEESGIDDIYIQVYRADKAYYDSSLTDRAEYDKMVRSAGDDLLPYIIEKAHEKDIKVHAWVNLLSIAQNENANILKKLGKGVIVLDQYGRTSMRSGETDELDKYYIRENQLFLEPGDPEVRSYLAGICEEIITKYPGFDGLHLDYIRYPRVVPLVPGSRFSSHGVSYGYDEANLGNFKEATGLDAMSMEATRDNFQKWDDWRRAQITSLVSEISEKIRPLSPSLEISATTIPSPSLAYLTTFQEWPTWVYNGHVDYLVAMNYTDDPGLMGINSAATILPDLETRVQIGLGAYLMKDDLGPLKEQLEDLMWLSPSGIVIFSYDEIAGSTELRGFLGKHFSQKPSERQF